MLRVFVGSCCILAASASFADQCAWNSRSVADQALRLIPPGSTIQSFCAPCKDSVASTVVVKTATIEKTSDPDYFQVIINGEPYDLAYLYVRKTATDPTFTNLGLLVQCAVDKDSVPTDLPTAALVKPGEATPPPLPGKAAPSAEVPPPLPGKAAPSAEVPPPLPQKP